MSADACGSSSGPAGGGTDRLPASECETCSLETVSGMFPRWLPTHVNMRLNLEATRVHVQHFHGASTPHGFV